jgi:hypothetical protein
MFVTVEYFDSLCLLSYIVSVNSSVPQQGYVKVTLLYAHLKEAILMSLAVYYKDCNIFTNLTRCIKRLNHSP